MKLKDPLKDRQINEVPIPPQKRLPSEYVWDDKNKPQWKNILKFQENQGLLSKKDVLRLFKLAAQILKSCVIELEDPITIVGDTHGQYYDLLTVFKLGGRIMKDDNKYLFLGDYVDRGFFSSIKVAIPDRIYLLRGNHETREMTRMFNFQKECYKKYDQEVYEELMLVFDTLPLAAKINNKFFAVHGGLSPQLKRIGDINKVNRFKEVPKSGMLCDLVWSDPTANDQGELDHLYQPNDVRKCSYYYGKNAVRDFLRTNKLMSIIRAHEVQFEGFKLHQWNIAKSNVPSVITVFSAPNYCDKYKNQGAIIRFVNNELTIEQYKYKISPFYLPDFQNLFDWSIPFIGKNVLKFVTQIIKVSNQQIEQDIRESQFAQAIEDLNNDPDWVQKVQQIKALKKKNQELVKRRITEIFDQSKRQSMNLEGLDLEQSKEDFKVVKKQDRDKEARPQKKIQLKKFQILFIYILLIFLLFKYIFYCLNIITHCKQKISKI